MENLIVTINITATSVKQDGRFKAEKPTKTAYIKGFTSEDDKKLENFGLRKYTSQQDGEDFFIIKFASKLQYYDSVDRDAEPKDWSALAMLETHNFTFDHVNANIIKAEHNNNEFFRIQALQGDLENFAEIKPENPFA